MNYIAFFRMPTPMKISGRSSSITNAFINSIIPIVYPTDDEVKEAFEILKITPATYQCSYCGDKASEWDHLRPLVKDKKPTGYISEIQNLVPSCGKCNQSKGNKNWAIWIQSQAKLSPASRGIKDLNERISRLKAYELWKTPTKVDFLTIVGNVTWEAHWANWEKIQKLIDESQKLAAEINQQIASAYKSAP